MKIKLVMPPKHTVSAYYIKGKRVWEIFVHGPSGEFNLPKTLRQPMFELSGEHFRKEIERISEELHSQFPEITRKQVEDALKKECVVNNCKPPKYLK